MSRVSLNPAVCFFGNLSSKILQTFYTMPSVIMCGHVNLKVRGALLVTRLCTLSQAKRLDELDRLYRDEALARKKTHNAMEDLKVGRHPVLQCSLYSHCAGQLRVLHDQHLWTGWAEAADLGLKVGLQG